MKTILQQTASLLIAGAVLLVGWASLATDKAQNLAGIGGLTAAKCTPTHSVATIGHQLSSTILSAASNRAWAVITLPTDSVGVATNTPAFSFDGGSAVLATDYRLSTSTPEIVFGRATVFPYVDAVTGITDVGSTTVRVTQCLY